MTTDGTPTQADLKPCPFCGSKAGIGSRSYKTPRKSGVQHSFTANCCNPDCLAVVAAVEGFDTELEAIASWNTRASQPEAGEPVAEIVLFGGDLKEVAWRKGKMPPAGTKLYAHPIAVR